MPKIAFTGRGNVMLIAGGGKVYTDIAARFVRSERSISDIIASPYDKEILKNILDSNHKAALEFDWFLFAMEGYSRVTEVQMVRKRIASYMIKSGRAELDGKRQFSVVVPREIGEFSVQARRNPDGQHWEEVPLGAEDGVSYGARDLIELTEIWYNAGARSGIAEEKLRYMKPQATEFKAIVGMNGHALMDFFAVRCCNNAQAEIRDMADKMLHLVRHEVPDMFVNAGASCVQLGYCPEGKRQCAQKRHLVYTKDEMTAMLRANPKHKLVGVGDGE